MGMFSFICPVCGKPIVSNEGSRYRYCVLFLKENGQVIHSMSGLYSGYGKTDRKDWPLDWDTVCALMFDDEPESGILAFHSGCYIQGREGLFSVSLNDPDQGWIDPDEFHFDDA
jgi:hypothetical protein